MKLWGRRKKTAFREIFCEGEQKAPAPQQAFIWGIWTSLCVCSHMVEAEWGQPEQGCHPGCPLLSHLGPGTGAPGATAR